MSMSADIDRQIAEARARMERSKAFRESTQSTRGRGEADGIRVEVDNSGRLASIQLPQNLSVWSGDRLGPKIVAVTKLATADLARKVQAQAIDTFGPEDAVTNRVRQELTEHFGDYEEGEFRG